MPTVANAEKTPASDLNITDSKVDPAFRYCASFPIGSGLTIFRRSMVTMRGHDHMAQKPKYYGTWPSLLSGKFRQKRTSLTCVQLVALIWEARSWLCVNAASDFRNDDSEIARLS